MGRYVIVGSGIIGLYTAYCLLLRDVTDIEVIAEYLPGDESVNYTSPYAGGNFSCITGDEPAALAYDKFTYTNLGRLQAALGGPACGLDRYMSTEFWGTKPSERKLESLKSYMDDYEEIEKSQLPEGAGYGIKFMSWNFNCPFFLLNLQSYLAQKGVKFTRKKLTHISQAYLPGAKVVFNCTGLGSHSLGGVNDKSVYPTRGQVVVIKAPHITENRMIWANNVSTYIIKRPYSNDQLVLGGFMHKDNWSGDTLRDQTQDILARTTKLFPEILSRNKLGPNIADLEVVRQVAGLRPSRHGGVRIEREYVEPGTLLVHNYGASGYGYQSGLGMAHEAVRLAFAASSKI